MTVTDASPADTDVKSGSERRLRAALRGSLDWLPGTLAVVLVFLGWQVTTAYALVDPLFLPAPLDVLIALKGVVTSPSFANDLGVSAYEFLWGLGLSILIGGVLGILSGWYPIVEKFLQPLVVGLNSIPHLALIPLLILLFGIGTLPKIILVLLSCIVVMLMNTAAGVKSVDSQLMRMSKSFKASDPQLIRTVVVPSVVPYFMTGIRICVGRAVVAVAVAEIFGSVAGLGNILIKAQSAFNMPVMFAAVIILTVIGMTLTYAAGLLERRLLRWKA